MAVLTVLATLAIVYIAPAALPDGQQPTWASGRYPDAMSVTFFLSAVSGEFHRKDPAHPLSFESYRDVLTRYTAMTGGRRCGPAMCFSDTQLTDDRWRFSRSDRGASFTLASR